MPLFHGLDIIFEACGKTMFYTILYLKQILRKSSITDIFLFRNDRNEFFVAPCNTIKKIVKSFERYMCVKFNSVCESIIVTIRFLVNGIKISHF